jgi:hypothetical protein
MEKKSAEYFLYREVLGRAGATSVSGDARTIRTDPKNGKSGEIL